MFIKYHQIVIITTAIPAIPDDPADVPPGHRHCFADVPRGGQWRGHALRPLGWWKPSDQMLGSKCQSSRTREFET